MGRVALRGQENERLEEMEGGIGCNYILIEIFKI